MMNKKIFLPFDIYSRHKTVARLMDKEVETIFDVGGGTEVLEKFLPNKKVTVSNLTSGDIRADGRNLPVDDKSFNAVVSVDVLEHVSKNDRIKFIKELIRAAKKQVIISFPYGSEEHIVSEKKLLIFLQKKGQECGYLKEHIYQTLPVPEKIISELKKAENKMSINIYYSGDFRLNNILSRWQAIQIKNNLANHLFYYFQRFINLFLNIFYYPFCLKKTKNNFVNRVFLVIENFF